MSDRYDNIPFSRSGVLVVCVLFCLILCLPLTGRLYNILQTSGPVKDRIYDAFPSYDFGDPSIRSIVTKYPAYFNQYHVLRKQLIGWHAQAIFGILDISPNDRVVVGHEGWIFLNSVENTMAYYRGVQPFTTETLEAWREALERKRDWLAQRGIRYLFMVAPNKHSIYGAFIPDTYNKVNPTSRLDQLGAYMRTHSDVRFVDPRQPLLESRNEHELYYKDDTHWNDRGAYIAYKEAATVLQEWFPSIQPVPLSALAIDRELYITGHYALMGLNRVYEGEAEALRLKDRHFINAEPVEGIAGEVTEADIPELPRALMFQDSFGKAMQPFFSEHFGRIVYVNHDTHQRGSIDTTIILQERPDIVIEEMVERDLMKTGPVTPFLKHSAY